MSLRRPSDAELADAVAKTAEAAEHAKQFPSYDLAKFRPVRGDHLAVVIEAVRAQQIMTREIHTMLKAICTHLDLDPRETPEGL